MSNYLSMTQPSQAEIDQRVISKFGPLLRQDKRYGSEVASVLNSSRSNKDKKNALISIIAKKQKAPNGFFGGSVSRDQTLHGAKRSTRSRRHRRRTHKRRTSRS